MITVTGSTGTIGSELVQLLSERGLTTRAIYRTAGKTWSLPQVSWVQADLREPEALEQVLAGTERLFMLTGNQPWFAEVQIAVAGAAQAAGVHHIVKLSALGASDHSRSWIGRLHWEVEQAIQQTSMKWTILRPHAFMQNWLDEIAESARAVGVIYSPIGAGKVPFVDTRDIAEVAALVLADPDPHAGRKYTLTGGEAVGYADLAAEISRETGRPVTYRPISMEEARERMSARGMSEPAIEALLAIASYQKEGGATAMVSPHVERLLGRPPRAMQDFVRDYAHRFEPRE